MRRLVVTLIVLGACSGRGPQRVGAQPSWRGGTHTNQVAGPVTFAPASEPVMRYNEPPQAAPHTALGHAVTAAVKDAATRAGLHAPVPDARLFRACTELAEVVPDEGLTGYRTLVEFALQRNGIIEPSSYLFVMWGEINSPQLIVERLQPRLAEFLSDRASARLGVGAAKRKADGSGVVVFALQSTGVSTSPIPREVEVGGSVMIDAVVDSRYHDPEVYVTYDDGGTQQLELKAGRPGSFTSQVACATHKGRQQIEITANGAAGPAVLANFPLWCGEKPPASVTVDPEPDDALKATSEGAEHRLLASVNRDRAAAGLPMLLWDDRIAAVARHHSEDMHRTHVVAHISRTTGSAVDRVQAVKIRPALVLENVAMAYSIAQAHQALMNSPGHRINIMWPATTHIGIGVVLGEKISGWREIFITQVFTRVTPTIDRRKAIAMVWQKLVAVRPMFLHKPALAARAQQLADALAAGETVGQAHRRLDQIEEISRSQLITSKITVTADLDVLGGSDLLGDSAADDVGIGIAQGSHPEIGDNAIWIVLQLMNDRSP
jgi:uncharacterized protein YkwD